MGHQRKVLMEKRQKQRVLPFFRDCEREKGMV